MSSEEHIMSEEFKPIRITLSEEAFNRLEVVMKVAKFRSYSSTIEECIRAIYDVMDEIYILAGEPSAPSVDLNPQDCTDSMHRIIVRMSRLTGRTMLSRSKK